MAFRQTERPPQPAPIPSFRPGSTSPAASTASPGKQTLGDSPNWVLFSPSDAISSVPGSQPRIDSLVHDNLEEDDDDEDFDSLDDGLHAFHELPEPVAAVARDAVLPTHDRLGSFANDYATLQQQLCQLEAYSSRVGGPSSSYPHIESTLDNLPGFEEPAGLTEEQERVMRIERWRLEQSKALLEEIEREMPRLLARSTTGTSTHTTVKSEDAQSNTTDRTKESLLCRFTRTILQGLMGFDESLLSVIFGEILPDESLPGSSPSHHHSDLEPQLFNNNDDSLPSDSWEIHLLRRIARELGKIVYQLSEHPGAFSTYLQTQENIPYVGQSPYSNIVQPGPIKHEDESLYDPFSSKMDSFGSPSAAFFEHSIPVEQSNDPSCWGVEESPEAPHLGKSEFPVEDSTADRDLEHDREYWERQLDVKMVFSFLRRRFSSNPAALQELNFRSTPKAHRAAIIRQHHPLVSPKTQPKSRPQHHPSGSHYSVGLGPYLLRTSTNWNRGIVGRRSSSCTSSRESRLSGGSRNYWDLGASVESGAVDI